MLPFDARLVPSLPPMAWLYRMGYQSRPELIHGRSVELLPDGFFEGCFSGKWLTGDFANCPDVFGSGLKIDGGVHHFAAPSHTLEGIFTLSRGGELAVSNSLCFLLEFHGATLPVDLSYGSRFASAALGIDAYEKHLASTNAGNISWILFDNLRVAEDLTAAHARKPNGAPFTDYNSYVRYLKETVGSALANASDPGRSVKFSPLTTCSSGYDSSAVSAIASQLGCRTAITLKTSRDGADDSGLPVGQALGLEVIEAERTQRVDSFEDVAEFLASGMGGEDYCYRDFSHFLDGRALMTAFYGDHHWDMESKPNEIVSRLDLCGGSLQEFRLQRNFIHIPVPIIGTRRHSQIFAISRMEEMKPYTLNNDYDRPIPRRIVEESGVQRELFGQEKKAASILLFLNPGLLRRAALSSRERIAVDTGTRVKILLLNLSWNCRYFLYRLTNNRLTHKAGSLFPTIKILSKLFVRDMRIFEHEHPKAVLDFLGGVMLTRRRYSVAGNIHKNATQ
ncbi:MAG: hypothetical protein ABSA48_07695 [Terracidiphilus sp.]|jgi:hypothetical protein